jgi:hypothetical protein
MRGLGPQNSRGYDAHLRRHPAVAQAKRRGEPIEPLIKRLVVETIEQVQERLERRGSSPS